MKSSSALALLVVDDSAHIRRAVSIWAAAMRYHVSCACNGEEAKSFLITRQFDVVLTDFEMPGMSGLDLVNWMRKHRPGVPVCLMSAAAASDGFCAERGPRFDGLLAKPFSPVALDACIRKVTLEKERPNLRVTGAK